MFFFYCILPWQTPFFLVWILFPVHSLWTGSSTDLTIDSILLELQIDQGENKNRKACVVGKESKRLPDSPRSGLRCGRACCHTPWPLSHSSPQRSRAGRRRCSNPRQCSCTWPRWHRVCDWCSSSDLQTKQNKKKQEWKCQTALLYLKHPTSCCFWERWSTLVTEDATPALFAGALIRLLAGTVFTGRMKFTHITKQSLPALSASVHTKQDSWLKHKLKLTHKQNSEEQLKEYSIFFLQHYYTLTVAIFLNL